MTRGPVLTGEIARLRPIEATDADRMWESLQDPEAMRLTGTTADFDREQIDEWARTVSDRPGRYDWALRQPASGSAPGLPWPWLRARRDRPGAALRLRR